MNLFPMASFDVIDNSYADMLLVQWGHWLGGCNRPFGRQSFGLLLEGLGAISVAVSASTVSATCGGYKRQEVIELARLCSDPEYRWATRVMLRLWRELAPPAWPHWPVRAVVSYSNALRHGGDVYRFDGWKKVADVRGSAGGGNWTRHKLMEPKSVWAYELKEERVG
jgi:hypothetical protein